MSRGAIVGSGSEIPPLLVTNQMLGRIQEATDEWVQERTGVVTRHFVEEGQGPSDLAVPAACRALEMAGVTRQEVDLVIFATMTPDHYFPGSGALLQKKLGLREVPCLDIRQQCAGFLYGLRVADAYIQAGMARTVLLVGAEVHTGFMSWTAANWDYMLGRGEVPPTPEEWAWNSRYTHLAVLFGDGAGAVVVQPSAEGSRGVVDCVLYTDGKYYPRLCVPGSGFRHRPYASPEQFERGDHIPFMDGAFVFKMATTRMIKVAREILQRNSTTMDEVSMVLMHQANLRINEYCQQALGVPDHKVHHNIQRYGNTTAATIPLLWDECVREGRLRPGDLVLMVAFGAGMNWGATLLRV